MLKVPKVIHLVVMVELDWAGQSREQYAQRLKEHLLSCAKEATSGYFPEITAVELVRR